MQRLLDFVRRFLGSVSGVIARHDRKCARQCHRWHSSLSTQAMNKNQKFLTYCGLAIFGITVLNAPWESKLVTGDFHENIPNKVFRHLGTPSQALNDGNDTTATLKSDSLLLEWVAIAVVYACAFAMLKSPVNEVNTKAERMSGPSKQTDAGEKLSTRFCFTKKKSVYELVLQKAAETGSAFAQNELAGFYGQR